MRTLSAPELLGVWERGLVQGPVARALELLRIACPEASADSLAEFSVGKRDSILLSLRESIFGPEMASLVTCMGCGEEIEMMFNVADVLVAQSAQSPTELSLKSGEYELRLRLPNSRDLIVAAQAGLQESRGVILDRCLLSASTGGAPLSVQQLPAAIVDAVASRMAEAD